MCTSISVRVKEKRIFSRNLDLEYEFGDGVIVVPRGYKIALRCGEDAGEHYAFLGVGAMRGGYPLLADGMNECGLCIAGLRYTDAQGYPRDRRGRFLTPFEIIPYLLAVCRDVEDVKGVLASYTVRDLDFDEDTKNEPMHFHVSGRGGDIVLEPRGGELLVYENKVHVLTNAPCFEDQILCLDKTLESGALHTGTCCGEGSCARVIPADYSSPSRFVRAAWLCRFAEGYAESGEDIYDLMRCVAPPKGAVVGKGGRLHYTRYTAIMDTEKLCYSVRRGSAKYTLTLTEALAGGVGLYTSPFK